MGKVARMQRNDADNPLLVILIGQSPIEQSLRGDPSIEIVRVPGMLNAIGELATLQTEERISAPVVIFGSEVQRSSDLGRCIESLRVVDSRVQIVGVRGHGNGASPSGAGSPIEAWVESSASASELRKCLTPIGSRDGSKERRRKSRRSDKAHSALSPHAEDRSDQSIVEDLLAGKDPINRCIELIRARSAGNEIRFVDVLDDPDVGADEQAVDVEHSGHRFGWLIGTGASLEVEADWLGTWIALARQHGQLRVAALTDPLTGGWNRRYFERYVRRAIERARERRTEVTLLLFDIDDFKQYNDRFGHEAGDEILCEVVRLAGSVIRPTDRVARLGGDEFGVIFDSPDGPRDPSARQQLTIYDVARRFQEQIRRHRFPKLGDQAPGDLTISGGLATFPWDANEADELVRKADQLILNSKAKGKNVICIGPGAVLNSDLESLSDTDQEADSGDK